MKLGFWDGFGKPVSAGLDAGGVGGGGTPWYRLGGAPLPIAAYEPKGAASLAASYINKINPGTYDITAVTTAPAHNPTTGWQFTVDPLNTGIQVNSLSWSYIVKVAGLETGQTRGVCGAYGTSDTVSCMLLKLNTGIRSYYGAASLTKTPEFTDGTYAVCGKKRYRNGVDEASDVPAGGSAPAVNFYIGAYNNNGVVAAALTQGYISSFAIWNSILTPAQVLAIHGAMP